MNDASPKLVRSTFRTSRLAEFASVRELIVQTGHDVDDWPIYIAKELTDNAIDIAEEHGVAPEITVSISTERGEIVIADNGPGILASVVDSIIDYTARTSSRAGYVSPSRGQQGAAVQSIIPMGFVLDHGIRETVIIEAHEVAHRIRFSVDPIKQEPRISCVRGVSTVRNGTRVTVRIACHLLKDAGDQFLPLVWDFVALNPHLAIVLDLDGEGLIHRKPTAPDWEKWKPSYPIPPAWYTPESLQRLIAASVNRDLEDGNRVRSVRDFLGGFAGLSSTAKRSVVLKETGLFRAGLDIFFDGERVDRDAIARLLRAMQGSGRLVKPRALGVIGEDHFRSIFAVDKADQDHLKYAPVAGEEGGLPYLVEVAFSPAAEVSTTPLVSGVNWSPAIHDPFRSLVASVLYAQHVDLYRDPVLLGVHVATPSVSFVDRGKSSVVLSHATRLAVTDAVRRVTKEWAAAWEKQMRELKWTPSAGPLVPGC
jgi:DNA topoisomerase VI subunit B